MRNLAITELRSSDPERRRSHLTTGEKCQLPGVERPVTLICQLASPCERYMIATGNPSVM